MPSCPSEFCCNYQTDLEFKYQHLCAKRKHLYLLLYKFHFGLQSLHPTQMANHDLVDWQDMVKGGIFMNVIAGSLVWCELLHNSLSPWPTWTSSPLLYTACKLHDTHKEREGEGEREREREIESTCGSCIVEASPYIFLAKCQTKL